MHLNFLIQVLYLLVNCIQLLYFLLVFMNIYCNKINKSFLNKYNIFDNIQYNIEQIKYLHIC